MLLVDDLAAGGTKNLRHTPRGLVTLSIVLQKERHVPEYPFKWNGTFQMSLQLMRCKLKVNRAQNDGTKR